MEVRHGDTDKSPYGLGTYGSRSTPVSGGAVAIVSRKVRDKARLIAATMLETRPEDLAWEKGRWYVKGDPSKDALIEDIASYAYSGGDMPEGLEGGLDAQVIYDPPNLTYPYGAYIAVVDIDPDTAQVTVRSFIAVDDCGVRINPMVVDGQIHGGLAEGIGIALMELISFDEEGNCLNSSFMDYLIPTALECPDFELGETVTPCPHHPLGAKGVGESPNVGSPPAIVNAVIDALHADARGRPHRHAVHAGPRLGRHAGARRAAAMIPAALARRAQELAAARIPFVTATVVRAQSPTSVEPGSVALVLADGTIEGFVGGVCAEQSVRAYSLIALDSGEPVLLKILPDGEESGVDGDVAVQDGAVTVRNPCLSGGAIEVFLEPAPPAPRVLVVGDTPIAAALRRIGAELELDMVTSTKRPAGGRRLATHRGRARSRRASGSCAADSRPASLRRPGRQRQTWRGGSGRAPRGRRGGEPARAHRGAGRHRDRLPHAGRDRGLDPGPSRSRAPNPGVRPLNKRNARFAG